MVGVTIKCRLLPDNSTEIVPISPVGKVWIGYQDVQDLGNKEGSIMNISRVIKHPQSYIGEGYKDYGGFDIALIEIDGNTTVDRVACLPSPKYFDTRLSNVAGYGRYFRGKGKKKVCLTDEYGPYKYHYCSELGSSFDICDDSPPPQDAACETFFKDASSPGTVIDNFDEINLVQGNSSVYCYGEKSGKKDSEGWCKVTSSFYDMNGEQKIPGGSWGFCSKDCYLEEDQKKSGVLRSELNVEVLDETMCDKFLNKSLRSEVQFRPKILCVGQLKTWKTDVWKFENGTYRRITDVKERRDFKHFGSQEGWSSIFL